MSKSPRVHDQVATVSVSEQRQVLPVLHIGFNKAGSTTLQRGLFARHSQVVSLGEPFKQRYPDANRAMFNAIESCNRDPARRTRFDLDLSRSLWQKTLASVEPGKIPVYSKETLTRPDCYQTPGDPCLPGRLRALVGPARIIIMARHQIRLLESLYITRTKGHYYQSPEKWFEANGAGSVRMFSYHAVARSYAEAFGRENVGVFLLEDLTNDIESFARRLCDFIGIDSEEGATLLKSQHFNSRTSHRTHIYSRLRKRLGPNIRLSRFVSEPIRNAFFRFMSGGRRVEISLPAQWQAEMESYYRGDNRQLAADWGLQLEKYGYPL
jgi:hypothetical protein